jgi:hypothetical protein
MDVPSSAMVASNAEAPPARDVSSHDTRAGGLVSLPCGSEGIGCEEVCGLLIERLQDVSVCFCCFR